VSDYVEGKLDWLAAGLPFEGTNRQLPTAGDVARADVPTCRVDEAIRIVRARAADAGWDACVAVNDDGVVFGLLRAAELAAGSGDEPVEQLMRPGPSTFRPYVSILEMAGYMVEHELVNCPITSSDGRLIGLLRREDAVARAHALHDHATHEGHDEDA
jgi:Mg/Co/Ni transporter MgtE